MDHLPHEVGQEEGQRGGPATPGPGRRQVPGSFAAPKVFRKGGGDGIL